MSESKELIDSGEINSYGAAKRLSAITAMQKILKEDEADLRAYLESCMVSKESLKTALAEVSYRAGTEGKWTVKDPYAFAQWLIAHGEESSTETAAIPLEFATKPDVLDAMVRSNGGEVPDGVEQKSGTKASISIKLVKDFKSVWEGASRQVEVREILGIEAHENKSVNLSEGDDWES